MDYYCFEIASLIKFFIVYMFKTKVFERPVI